MFAAHKMFSVDFSYIFTKSSSVDTLDNPESMDDDVDEVDDEDEVIIVASPHFIPVEWALELENGSSTQKSSLFNITINGIGCPLV